MEVSTPLLHVAVYSPAARSSRLRSTMRRLLSQGDGFPQGPSRTLRLSAFARNSPTRPPVLAKALRRKVRNGVSPARESASNYFNDTLPAFLMSYAIVTNV